MVLFGAFFVCFFLTSDSLIPSFLMSNVSESLRSLTKNEWCKRFAQVPHQKWAIMSKSLRSLTKNERIARFLERIAHLLIFSQKTSDSLRNPMKNSQPCNFRPKAYTVKRITWCRKQQWIREKLSERESINAKWNQETQTKWSHMKSCTSKSKFK